MAEKIKMTSDQGMFRKDGKLFKVSRYSGVHTYYEEIDPKQYDERIHKLAEQLASMPDVDLMDVLRDALYDVPLRRLEVIEQKLAAELEKKVPQVRTTKRDRGTCINLAIGGRYALELRA